MAFITVRTKRFEKFTDFKINELEDLMIEKIEKKFDQLQKQYAENNNLELIN